MKKTLKVVLLMLCLLVVLLALTGCGNKLVATKDVEETSDTPKHKEEVEVSFKNDKVDKVKMTFIFDNDDTAKKYVDEYNAMLQLLKSFAGEEEGEVNLPTLTQSGKKATMELDAKTFAEMSEDEKVESMTREEIKKSLEDEGYTVK